MAISQFNHWLIAIELVANSGMTRERKEAYNNDVVVFFFILFFPHNNNR